MIQNRSAHSGESGDLALLFDNSIGFPFWLLRAALRIAGMSGVE